MAPSFQHPCSRAILVNTGALTARALDKPRIEATRKKPHFGQAGEAQYLPRGVVYEQDCPLLDRWDLVNASLVWTLVTTR